MNVCTNHMVLLESVVEKAQSYIAQNVGNAFNNQWAICGQMYTSLRDFSRGKCQAHILVYLFIWRLFCQNSENKTI